MKTDLLICLLCLGLTVNATAQQRVPATREPIEVTQPDGSTLTVRLHGDERMHWRTTTDGYLIEKNAKGYYCYLVNKCKAQVVGKHTAKNPENRTKCEERYLKKRGIKR